MGIITTIKSWFKKEPENIGNSASVIEPRDLGAKIRITKTWEQKQHEKNRAIQKTIKYQDQKVPQGRLPIRDPYKDQHHGVPDKPMKVTQMTEENLRIHKDGSWEGKTIEFLDYVVEEDDDRL